MEERGKTGSDHILGPNGRGCSVLSQGGRLAVSRFRAKREMRGRQQTSLRRGDRVDNTDINGGKKKQVGKRPTSEPEEQSKTFSPPERFLRRLC